MRKLRNRLQRRGSDHDPVHKFRQSRDKIRGVVDAHLPGSQGILQRLGGNPSPNLKGAFEGPIIPIEHAPEIRRRQVEAPGPGEVNGARKPRDPPGGEGVLLDDLLPRELIFPLLVVDGRSVDGVRMGTVKEEGVLPAGEAKGVRFGVRSQGLEVVLGVEGGADGGKEKGLAGEESTANREDSVRVWGEKRGEKDGGLVTVAMAQQHLAVFASSLRFPSDSKGGGEIGPYPFPVGKRVR